MGSYQISLLCTLALFSISTAVPDIQQNYTICNWARLRTGIIRDAIYLDGGLLWWQTAFADGSTPVVASDGGEGGDMYRLNLSRPFDTSSTNLSALLEAMPKAGGAGNNIAPNYVDGTMFTNDGELYLYGGLPRLTDSSSGQTDNTVLGYEAYQYGPDRSSWTPGFYQGSSGDNVTRYVTNGAGVSAPSENLGFYFSGMRAPDWGEIHYEDSSANVTANTMIQVDMSTMRDEEWTNLTLPDEVRPRANAELVWLPVSERGVLVAVGGVTEPEEIYPAGLNSTQRSESEEISPSFMTSLPLYDIASEQWFVQNTTGTDSPPQLTQFCSVVAVDEDSSSFNVYIYGGYNGIDATNVPSDDVWVLSLPAFTWTKVYQGNGDHGRSGHQCVSPYPDKMFVIGGVHQNQAQCLNGGFIQVFNLNKLEFEDVYHPDDWEQYKAPEKISTANRRAVKRQIAWSSPELEKLFSTRYTQEVQHYYPYKSDGSLSDGSGDTNSGSGSSVNTTAIAVGVSIALLIIGIIILVIFLLRRRGMLRSGSTESSRTKRSRISQWIHGSSCPVIHSKGGDNDSRSSLNADMVKPYSNASEQVSSESSTPPTTTLTNNSRERLPPQEMAAVDRPHPPFELATPYNSQDHPRHRNTTDYAYKATTGHSSSGSQSNSSENNYTTHKSSKAKTYNLTTNYDDCVAEARADVERNSMDRSSTQSSSKAWPLPASRPNWTRTASSSSNNGDVTTHLLAPAPAVPPTPRQYRSLSYDTTPDRLRPVMPDQPGSNSSSSEPSTQSKQDSSISSMVSPIREANDEDWQQHTVPRSTPRIVRGTQRESLMGAISPVTPEETRGFAWQANEAQHHGRRGSSEGEGREKWWESRS
ncbi:uncharacterized protein HMPREF1541_06386 [Cyphellophora europaea CBS 101466]|uniref:Uncharacterized protein n=1 Tax=Cyphellophora europaea (strain CBS 101466) TaxID=1220924 RepID=W2RPA5_CYPE1|nr:uncharacterized protein HMPREF1541_06386 [Cyphellophora europaea CBS 101466]ETN38351.1 hypothetical protein HMPREF1541_06386 [Cyphellophora europaea CBS 101466]